MESRTRRGWHPVVGAPGRGAAGPWAGRVAWRLDEVFRFGTALRRLARTVTVALIGAVLVLASAMSALASDCEVSVEPRVAQAGTVFTLRGEGYTPTTLTLQKNDGRETAVELDLGDADPFEIPIGSNVGDEGRWHATVAVADTDCSATVTFRVTLLDTSTLSDVTAGRGGGLPPLAFVVAAVLGFTGGTLIGRRLRLA
jgi:hypothetical protein